MSLEPSVRAELRLARENLSIEMRLELPARGVSVFFGRSGAGKTTFLRLIAGLERGRGTLVACGECWQDDARKVFVPTERRGIGYVFQEASLFSHLTVRGNLNYALERRSNSRAAPSEASILEILDIGQLLSRAPSSLSGGERQRVAIARALLSAPRLLLMDEPLASLDDSRKAEVLPYLERLRDELSIPIVYVSHSIDEVARLADWLVLVENGRAEREGTLTELLSRLDSPLSHGEQAGVVLDARITQHDPEHHLSHVEFPGGGLWVTEVKKPLGSVVRARVLARDVSIALSEPGPSSILNVMPARVSDISDEGPDRVNVALQVGSGGTKLLARVTRRSLRALDLSPGAPVYAQVKSVALVT
ncbi:MAG TPA: molybdenum ABC transporter ATP-binding protein [Polyangiaceae bacterium]|nr:molybdenum ABC transporter ATP-binding protein [Polyangiaceae bacterium]